MNKSFYNFYFSFVFLFISFLSIDLKVAFAEIPLLTPAAIAKIQYGKSSPETKQLQIALNSLGYTVAEEGPGSEGKETERFDPALKKAIKEFQIENELKVTEKLDPPTVKVLNELITFINENSVESDEISNRYTESLDSTYGSDPDMNKDFFAEGGSIDFFPDGERDAMSYIGNALKNYYDIDITGGTAISGEDSILNVRRNPNNNVKAKTNSPTSDLEKKMETVNTGNIFADSMIKTILGNASILFYQTFVLGPSQALSQIGSSSRSENENNVDSESENGGEKLDIQKYYTDGKFDLVKCYADPICAKL